MSSFTKTRKASSRNIEFQSLPDCQSFQHLKFPVHCLQILVPRVMKLPDSFQEMLSSDQNNYFLIQDLPSASLIDHTFIEAFLKKGTAVGLSIDARAGIDNFAAVLPTGHLTLSLKQEVFENLDLIEDSHIVGRKRKKVAPPGNVTACVSIHTTSPTFNPSKKNYVKISEELEKINSIHFDLILNWIPHDPNICSTSVQEFFQSKGFACNMCKCEHVPELKYSVKIPKISFSVTSEDSNFCSQWDFLEWIGAQTCGIECEEEDENRDFVSSFAFPEPFDLERMTIDTWRGLIPTETICNILKNINQVFSQNKNVPFVTIVGHGFQDSWVATENKKYITSCDKMFCIVIFPELSCWLYSYIGGENINY